jgi:hypothetical protein
MMGRLGLTYLDHDGDRQTVSFEGADMTAANFDAQVTEQNAVVTACTLRRHLNGQRLHDAHWHGRPVPGGHHLQRCASTQRRRWWRRGSAQDGMGCLRAARRQSDLAYRRVFS